MKGYKKNGVDNIMNSLEGMQPARPQASVFAKLESRIANGRMVARTIPLRRVSLAAACILLLVLANVLMLSRRDTPSAHVQQDAMQSVASYYGLTDNMEMGL
jgi:hypothetical protein